MYYKRFKSGAGERAVWRSARPRPVSPGGVEEHARAASQHFSRVPASPRLRIAAERRPAGVVASRPDRAARASSNNRRAATSVEMAIVLLTFLMLVFGMLELGLAVMRHNIVSQAARRGARLAIVRGELAPPQLPAWGPEEYEAGADSSDEIAQAFQPFLAGLDLSRTTIRLEWPDGNNEMESRVRVRITTEHDPFLTFLFTAGWTLSGESTMPIAH